jgi:putative hydrolase of the HAD superfamily
VTTARWDAVIFDYGGVLCYAPARQDVAQCAECSGLDEETFYKLYTETREYYGLAAAGYKAHWHRVAKAAGLTISEHAVKQFIDKESELWTRPNAETLALAREAKAAGTKIAVLSNMTSELLGILRGKFDWLDEFDVRIWSCEKGCAKPDEIIYRTCLQQLGCMPERSLFFDDRPQNVEAAKRVGIDAHLFESAAQAREVLQRGPTLG